MNPVIISAAAIAALAVQFAAPFGGPMDMREPRNDHLPGNWSCVVLMPHEIKIAKVTHARIAVSNYPDQGDAFTASCDVVSE